MKESTGPRAVQVSSQDQDVIELSPQEDEVEMVCASPAREGKAMSKPVPPPLFVQDWDPDIDESDEGDQQHPPTPDLGDVFQRSIGSPASSYADRSPRKQQPKSSGRSKVKSSSRSARKQEPSDIVFQPISRPAATITTPTQQRPKPTATLWLK